jgi:hypothetical protein
MQSILNVTTALSILLLILVLASVRRARIRVEYSVSWIAAGAALLILSRSGALLEALAGVLGFPNAPTTLLLMAGSVFLLIFFRFSMIVSHLRDDNIALAQRVAILEYHIQSIRDHGNS